MQNSIKVSELYKLIGALKSQYLYMNSSSSKAKKEGKEYREKKEIGDSLFYIVEGLENAVEELDEKGSSSINIWWLLENAEQKRIIPERIIPEI